MAERRLPASRVRILPGALAVLVAAGVVAGVIAWRAGSGGDAGAGPVDEELAGRIRATDVATYVVALDSAAMAEVRVEAGTVLVDYERGGFLRFTLSMGPAPKGDLCRAAGYDADGSSDEGGSCEADGDRFTTAFEEMGSVGLRKGGTLVIIGNLTTESDPGIEARAFVALEEASPISADDLARVR